MTSKMISYIDGVSEMVSYIDGDFVAFTENGCWSLPGERMRDGGITYFVDESSKLQWWIIIADENMTERALMMKRLLA